MTVTRVFKPTAKTTDSASARAMIQIGRIVNANVSKPMDMIRLTRKGVQPNAVDELVKRGFTTSETAWIISPRTLSHRKQKHQLLTPEETGRWLRAAKIQALALEVFGDKEKAFKWLHKKRTMFDAQSAMEIMQTEVGAQLVEDTLNQIDAGYFA